MARTKRSIKVNFCVVCDDIRKELNNKYTLVGVYSNDIVVGGFPARFPLAFLINVSVKSKEKLECTFRFFSKPKGKRKRKKGLADLDVKLNVANPLQSISIPTPQIQLRFEEEEYIGLAIREHKGSWKEIKKLMVKKRVEEAKEK